MRILDNVAAILPITKYQRRVNALHKSLYWPILQKIVPPPGTSGWGFRFKNASECKAEARECAKFQASMEFGILKIVTSKELDPWARGSGPQIDQTAMRRAAGVFVVYAETGSVYDHRIRYCMPEPWAYDLGFINPIGLWGKLGAPQVNPYPASNKTAASFYKANGALKSRAGYVL